MALGCRACQILSQRRFANSRFAAEEHEPAITTGHASGVCTRLRQVVCDRSSLEPTYGQLPVFVHEVAEGRYPTAERHADGNFRFAERGSGFAIAQSSKAQLAAPALLRRQASQQVIHVQVGVGEDGQLFGRLP